MDIAARERRIGAPIILEALRELLTAGRDVGDCGSISSAMPFSLKSTGFVLSM